jgi:hypothetical protein
MQVITEERYDYMLEVLPPLYVSQLDGKRIKKGICCSEAYSHNDKGVVLTICFKGEDGNYYEGLANVFTKDGKQIWETYNHCYTTVIAETASKKEVVS